MGKIQSEKGGSRCPINHPGCPGPEYLNWLLTPDALGISWTKKMEPTCGINPKPGRCPFMPNESVFEMSRN